MYEEPSGEMTIVHYLDNHIGIVYKETGEIVGFQIEGLRKCIKEINSQI